MLAQRHACSRAHKHTPMAHAFKPSENQFDPFKLRRNISLTALLSLCALLCCVGGSIAACYRLSHGHRAEKDIKYTYEDRKQNTCSVVCCRHARPALQRIDDVPPPSAPFTWPLPSSFSLRANEPKPMGARCARMRYTDATLPCLVCRPRGISRHSSTHCYLLSPNFKSRNESFVSSIVHNTPLTIESH